MKNLLSLILIIGAVITGWIHRDRLSGLWASAEGTLSSVGSSSSGASDQRATGTPHPAREAQARATALYPGLALPHSALNQKFVALYKDAQLTEPALLASPEWPIQLAERAVVSLGGAPMPRGASETGAAAATSAPVRVEKAVIVYTTSSCPYCRKAKDYLTKKGVRFREVNVETSLEGREAYRKLGASGVPIIMVGEQKVNGFNAQALDRLLL